ncbi:Cohesin subunit SA-1 [Trichinella murrelli]|uniref:Cohesin subunit SA-1 n=1 Tax=Trichinella murrelli TaxID=144512 RepID=A0A0V0U0U0_9BILA|nr:Cohesin subunit SA-1 [Trichinella murrelli]
MKVSFLLNLKFQFLHNLTLFKVLPMKICNVTATAELNCMMTGGVISLFDNMNVCLQSTFIISELIRKVVLVKMSNSSSPSTRPMRLAKQGAYETMSNVLGLSRSHHKVSQSVSGNGSSVSVNPRALDEILDSNNPSVSAVAQSRSQKRKSPNDSEVVFTTPKRGRPAGRGRGRPPNRPVLDKEASLYFLIKEGKAALIQVADDWIEHYQKDADLAVMDLIQFFISSTGCKGIVTLNDIRTDDFSQLIRKMTEDFDEDSGDYPIIIAGLQWKKFRRNFCDFVKTLIKQCQYSVIYDQYLMDIIISLLTGLADSQVRAFRHTATLAAMKVMTALVEIAVRLSQSLASVSKQFETERTKQRKGNQRIEALMQKKHEYSENKDEIINMLDYIFKSVFVHRYRDSVPEIRSLCVTELGEWILNFPEHFLDDSHLKYVGWTLYDKVGEVRLRCLQTLLPLYQEEQFAPRLELFTNKFKVRLVSMVLDKENETAVLAVKLVTCMQRHFPALLVARDNEMVYELIYSVHRGLALAAGEFLLQQLFNVKTPGRTRSRQECKATNKSVIRDLVQFHKESKLHEHAAYLVDSLYDSHDLLKDWTAMTELLLHGDDKQPLDREDESLLIDIMACSVKEAATGEPPIARSVNKKYVTQKEHKQVQDDQARLTEHFAEHLPVLLQKFTANPRDVENLLTIVQRFNIEVYGAAHYLNHLNALVKCLEEIFERHADEELLGTCSRTYECLCSEKLPVHVRPLVTGSTLIDLTMLKLRQEIQQFNSVDGALDEEDIVTLITSMRRIEALHQCHDLSKWDVWDLIFPIVKQRQDYAVPPNPEMMRLSVKTCYWSLLWALKAIADGQSFEDSIPKLKQQFQQFCTCCRELMESPVNETAETTYLILCDLLLIFGWSLPERNEELTALVFEADQSLEDQLEQFVRRKVFVDDAAQAGDVTDEEAEIVKTHRRRIYLAAFCKLVVFGVVTVASAVHIFKNYVTFQSDFGDIIRVLLNRCRESDKMGWAKTMIRALCALYQETVSELDPENRDKISDAIYVVHELAKRFAMSFGSDPTKTREAIVTLHREGIDFACAADLNTATGKAPRDLPFLEALNELSNRLLKQDKRIVLNYLNRHFNGVRVGVDGEWQPLITYRNSLVESEDEAALMPPPPLPPPLISATVNKGQVPPPLSLTPSMNVSSPFVPVAASSFLTRRTARTGTTVDTLMEVDFEEDFAVVQLNGFLAKMDNQRRFWKKILHGNEKSEEHLRRLASNGSEWCISKMENNIQTVRFVRVRLRWCRWEIWSLRRGNLARLTNQRL